MATAQVVVENGRVADSTRVISFDACAASRQDLLSKVVARSFSDLLAELVLFNEGVLSIDFGPLPIEARFDAELGFPLSLRINAAIDEKKRELPKDSRIPSDYEYTVVAFRMGANGT